MSRNIKISSFPFNSNFTFKRSFFSLLLLLSLFILDIHLYIYIYIQETRSNILNGEICLHRYNLDEEAVTKRKAKAKGF